MLAVIIFGVSYLITTKDATAKYYVGCYPVEDLGYLVLIEVKKPHLLWRQYVKRFSIDRFLPRHIKENKMAWRALFISKNFPIKGERCVAPGKSKSYVVG